jgi:ribosomal-protein-serine acetyltransferase
MTGLLPELLSGPGDLVLRRWRTQDAEGLGQAVTESLEHLRPWMPWVTQEPMPVADRARIIDQWEEEWRAGGDLVLGVFVGSEIAGGCGLHRRIGAGGIEIGYWIHPAFTRRRIATTVATVLTDAAFTRPDISYVEIHHDKANELSGRIPRRLGYQFVGEEPDEAAAPAEIGISCHWRATRDKWRSGSAATIESR